MTVFYLQRRYDVDTMLCPPVLSVAIKRQKDVGPIALKGNEMNTEMSGVAPR
jgi:hypothetical protein